VTASFIGRSRVCDPVRAVWTVTRQEMATVLPARDSSQTRQKARVSSQSPGESPCVFARCVR